MAVASSSGPILMASVLQIPGVPIMYIQQHQYSIERLPEATIGGGMISWKHLPNSEIVFAYYNVLRTLILSHQ